MTDNVAQVFACIYARVWVDGREWDYSEAHLGGVLITPAPER